ncbi:Salivary acidic proline-rich phosphoprotein 1/2 [Microbotryomycetes sp. JL201]|nr:Salivary acidic proline-rich phosphoprotein 1/2 [Microbotryomycetes sp. JL201]
MGRVASFDDEDEHARATKRIKVDSDAELAKQTRLAERRHLQTQREQLPVWQAREAILEGIAANDTIIVLGETGSGKTTQIPHFILRSCVPVAAPRVACTQPRRVAATSLATRVAAEAGCELGKLVGYTVRFDDKSTKQTRLKYMTDGALLAEMLEDTELDRYDVVVLDEAHERSLRTDMLMGFLKIIQQRRKVKAAEFKQSTQKAGEKQTGNIYRRDPTELKIVVMSATIDAEKFSNFFNNAPILFVQGRQHSVKTYYTAEPVTDYLDAALKTVFAIHMKRPPGDVLVFLPGQDDIESLAALIQAYQRDLHASFPKHDDVAVHALYAKLSPTEQARAFLPAPQGTRKIVLATNVAETSITIPGIRYVVDSGLAKEKEYHAGAGQFVHSQRMTAAYLVWLQGIDSLVVESINNNQAAGFCYRLYPESTFAKLDKTTKPEIQRVSLTFAMLQLAAAGQYKIWDFAFMDRPATDAIKSALLSLHALDAIDRQGKITTVGRQMASLPLEPSYARILLASFEQGCPRDVIDLVALLGSRDTLLNQSIATRDAAAAARRKFMHRTGDHLTLLNILRAYEDVPVAERKSWCREHFINVRAITQVLDARKQLRERCERMSFAWDTSNPDDTEHESVLISLVAGLFNNTALLQADGTYKQLMSQRTIHIHPGSCIHNKRAPAIIYDELVLTTKTYARNVSSIDPNLLTAKGPSVLR